MVTVQHVFFLFNITRNNTTVTSSESGQGKSDIPKFSRRESPLIALQFMSGTVSCSSFNVTRNCDSRYGRGRLRTESEKLKGH